MILKSNSKTSFFKYYLTKLFKKRSMSFGVASNKGRFYPYLKTSYSQNCISCTQCISDCPHQALKIEDRKLPIMINYSKCTGCRLCIDVCPEAILSQSLMPLSFFSEISWEEIRKTSKDLAPNESVKED